MIFFRAARKCCFSQCIFCCSSLECFYHGFVSQFFSLCTIFRSDQIKTSVELPETAPPSDKGSSSHSGLQFKFGGFAEIQTGITHFMTAQHD